MFVCGVFKITSDTAIKNLSLIEPELINEHAIVVERSLFNFLVNDPHFFLK